MLRVTVKRGTTFQIPTNTGEKYLKTKTCRGRRGTKESKSNMKNSKIHL